jgi:hypothetical protein
MKQLACKTVNDARVGIDPIGFANFQLNRRNSCINVISAVALWLTFLVVVTSID